MSRQRPTTDLLNGVGIGVIEVTQEPEDAGAQDLSKQQDKRSKVEDVDHTDQPMDEHGSARCHLEAVLTVLQGGVKHALAIIEKTHCNVKYGKLIKVE